MRTRIPKTSVKLMSVSADKMILYAPKSQCMPKRKKISYLFKN